MIQCCNGCVPPKRHLACWSDCPDYIAEKEEEDRKKTAYKQEHLAETYRYAMLKEHHIYTIEKRRTKRGVTYRKKPR